MPAPDFIRTQTEGCFQKLRLRGWGFSYHACEDPDGQDLTAQDLKRFAISSKIPKLPADYFTAILKLFFHYQASSEVSVLLLRNYPHFDQYKVVVHHQEVSPYAVRAEASGECLDLITGERYPEFPPAGWAYVGTAHSHQGAPPIPSPKDNETELPVPGLHFIVGSMRGITFQLGVSIVHCGVRYFVASEKVIDQTMTAATYHPAVLELIKAKPRETVQTKTTSMNHAGWSIRQSYDQAESEQQPEDCLSFNVLYTELEDYLSLFTSDLQAATAEQKEELQALFSSHLSTEEEF